MPVEPIQVRMLGEFSLRCGENIVSDTGNRSKKVWVLLACLLTNKDRPVSQQKLTELLWGEDASSTNPENALRITLHRLRALLDGLWPGAGRELIVRKDGGYCWNSQVSMELDCDRFEELCRKGGEPAGFRLDRYLEALSLYRGEFLPRQASETWVIPISTHFQNLYLNVTLEAAELLSAAGRHKEAADLCRRAIPSEPYHEPLHQMLIRELGLMGDAKGAAAVYESLSRRLFDDFGIRPNEETRSVYRAAAHAPEDRTLPMDEVLEHLQEPTSEAGAMQCDYDYFKVLCYAESRSMERSGNATHIALLSLSGLPGKPLAKRTQTRIMEQLSYHLRTNLRRGDTISQCSVSQYIIMLPKANYENSCMVCRRIIAAFHKAHPHVAATVHYMVQPLTPSVHIPL